MDMWWGAKGAAEADKAGSCITKFPNRAAGINTGWKCMRETRTRHCRFRQRLVEIVSLGDANTPALAMSWLYRQARMCDVADARRGSRPAQESDFKGNPILRETGRTH